jgi:hypothetical protein
MKVRGLVFLPALLAVTSVSAQDTKATPDDARRTFQQVLDAADKAWFGEAYKDINAVDLQGAMSVTVTPQALNAKVNQYTQGQVKNATNKPSIVNLRLKGTYFANSDFRTELSGDFGNLVYTRVGNRGFIYSVEQNAYTTKVDLPPVNVPLSFMGWFREVIAEIKHVYVDGRTFNASLGKVETVGNRSYQTVIFSAPTNAYDPKKREQSLAESLGFWKRGRLQIRFDRSTKLPHRMSFFNEAQGMSTGLEFSYDGDGRLVSVQGDNQSKGAQEPASLTLGYGGDGLINHIAGDLKGARQDVTFDLNLQWAKGKKASSIVSVPPPGATKKGGDELRAYLAVNLAGKILELQRKGLNLRSVTLATP